MNAGGVAYLVMCAVLLFPVVLPGGSAYLRFVLAKPAWVAVASGFTFVCVKFLVRRAMELLLRVPGAAGHSGQGGGQ